MKTLKFLFVGAIALMTMLACNKEEESGPNNGTETVYNDAWYAANATITSSDSEFTNSINGGTIKFKTIGGQVTVFVSCGTEWVAEDSDPGVFTISTTSTSLTVTAGQNLVEEKLSDTITLKTASEGVWFATIIVTQNAYGTPEITVDTNKWHAPAVGALSTEIGVESTCEWEIEETAEWLKTEKAETSIRLTAVENEDIEERTAEVVIISTNGMLSDTQTITVTQDARAYIILSEENLSLSRYEGATSVTVETNFDWEYAYDTSNGWFTVVENEGDSSFTISYTENSTRNEREGVVTVTAGDGAENIAVARLDIIQSEYSDSDLILEYTITSPSTTIQLPIWGTSVTIDWDDGTTTTASSLWPSHTYSTPGIYTVIIGGVTYLQSYSDSHDSTYNTFVKGISRLTGVKQWGTIDFTRMRYAFYGCSGLSSLPDGAGPFSNVTTFEGAFRDCSSLKELPEGLFDNCVSAETFECCFYGCSGLTGISAGLFENCPSVTNFRQCFYNCSGLTSMPSGLFDNCPSVTNFSYCFYRCSGLTSVPSGLFDNCPSVTNFEYCFNSCSGLTSVPYDLFSNCTSVTTFYYCFYNCSSLVSAPSFEGLSKVTTFQYCFYGCSSLVSPPSFKGCSSAVTTGYYGTDSFYRTFYGCDKLVIAPSFEGCSSLTSVPDFITDKNTWTTLPENMFSGCSKITSFSKCFYGCSALETVPVNIFDGTSVAVDFSSAFYGCSSVKGESPYTKFEINGEDIKIHLYERGDYYLEIRYSNPTSYSKCFTNSTFSDMDSIPSSWGGNGE